MTYQLTLTGTRTLLMKNIEGANPKNEYVQALAQINALKTKVTPALELEREYLKWRGALYWDAELGPVLPGANIFKSIHEAATLTRQGKDVERSLMIHTLYAKLEFPGKRELAALWNKGTGIHVDQRMCRVNRAPILCVRPAFPVWSATVEFDLDEDVMSLPTLEFLAEKAGRLIHIGDYRRFYGAYDVTVTK